MPQNLDPKTPPPLPPEIKGRQIRRVDGVRTVCVSERDAAKLMGKTEEWIRSAVNDGRVEICADGAEIFVLIESLWLLVPEEERRG